MASRPSNSLILATAVPALSSEVRVLRFTCNAGDGSDIPIPSPASGDFGIAAFGITLGAYIAGPCRTFVESAGFVDIGVCA